MNINDENPRGANELNDEDLEEISGGKGGGVCCCPRCNQYTYGTVGARCPFCDARGIESYVVKA